MREANTPAPEPGLNRESTAYTPGLWVILACLLFLCQDTLGMDVSVNHDYQVIEHEVLFIEGNHSSKIADLVNIPPDRWRPVENTINFGYTDQPYWFRVSLSNLNNASVERLLVVPYPLLDHIEFYQVQDKKVVNFFQTGDELPFYRRPIQHRYFIFPIEIPANEVDDIFIKVQTSGALQVPLEIWQERAFFTRDAGVLIGNAIYYGILAVMAAFILMLYFALRDRTFLLYVFFVLSILLLMSSLHGFTYQYIYPDSPLIHGMVLLVIVPLSQIAICAFTIEFLKLRQQQLYWYRLFIALMIVEGLCIIGAFILPYGISTRISVTMTIPIAIMSFVAGFRFWQSGDKSARMFSIAWIAFLAGGSITVLNRLGIFPISFISEYGIPLSTTMQSVLFALALASRFSEERYARLKAQEQMVEALNKQRNVEKQLIHSVSHNEVTGLPNRVLFERALQPFVDQPPTGCECISIVMLHLRRFDDVNKTLGHRNADVLLGQIGQRISNVLSSSEDSIPLEKSEYGMNYAAHIEGVSFAFALAKPSRNETIKALEPLIREMSQPIEFMKLQLELSFIVGCSFAGEERDPQTLLRQAFIAFDTADIKMSTIAIYSPEMNPYSPRRLTLMTELRAALESNTLELFFQPQIHLAKRCVCGFEALLRWKHPEYGMVPPDEFIPMAEKTGLMKPLTSWVIKHAVNFIADLDELNCSAYVSVNISALNLREPDFSSEVVQILQDAQVAPQRLVLEVTETAAMIDPAGSVIALKQLQSANIRVAIDDFGTGHSSLSYIRKLPVQEIKIDRSFVMEMDSNKGDETIVRTTVNMCHDLGYEVVAEGVENEPILELLGKLHCDIIQGHFVARPMNRSDMLAWLQQTDWLLQPEDEHASPSSSTDVTGKHASNDDLS
ncbi:Phytochrome-like protein cph2 [Thalassocella blandensis]|nr:Phytochrome-like protein cph2 [Thalassocella blandensis]